MMIYIQESESLQKFINFLNKPFLELEVFYNTYTSLIKFIYNYKNFNPNLIKKLLKNINDYYKYSIFENNKIKDLQKTQYDIILKQHMLLMFQISISIFKEDNLFNVILPKELEDFNYVDLDIIKYLIDTNNLEKRVLGIRALEDLIKLIIQNENKNEKDLNFMDPKEFLNLIAYRKKTLLDWLEKIKIFEIIFGENIHEAILKKSANTLIFLYMNNKLAFEKIDFIWKMTQDKHEAISASIQSIFSDLISHLSLDHVMVIL
jgi:hypothetical protein